MKALSPLIFQARPISVSCMKTWVSFFFRNGFVILRGCENLPVRVGTVELPAAARFGEQLIDGEA